VEGKGSKLFLSDGYTYQANEVSRSLKLQPGLGTDNRLQKVPKIVPQTIWLYRTDGVSKEPAVDEVPFCAAKFDFGSSVNTIGRFFLLSLPSSLSEMLSYYKPGCKSVRLT
jgi:hypothetical protein